MDTTTMGVKLDAETHARLKKLGEVKNRSPHWLIQEALRRYLEVEERYEQEKAEDLVCYQEYLDTSAHITHTDMMAWLDELADRAARKVQAE